MAKIDSETKKRILAAAEQVFHTHGFKGTRTTMIAEVAGISRTMLHYHYSTKEDLFGEVLQRTMTDTMQQLKMSFSVENKNLTDLVAHLIDVFADLLEKKPSLATFIINILHKSPEMTMMLASSEEDTVLKLLNNLLEEAREIGEITTNITGENLIIDIYALCIGPYLSAPYIKIKENRDDFAMQVFIKNRRSHIKTMIINSLM